MIGISKNGSSASSRYIRHLGNHNFTDSLTFFIRGLIEDNKKKFFEIK